MIFLSQSIFLISLVTSGAYATDIVTVEATAPGCYQRPNTAVQTAIGKANSTAEYRCNDEPVLVDLEVDIRSIGGCQPVQVVAKYSCTSKGIVSWCESHANSPCCVDGDYICF